MQSPHARYRILTTQAPGPIGTDFERAAQELAEQVDAAMAEGWEPIGGVEVAHPLGGGQPTLLQAMVKHGG